VGPLVDIHAHILPEIDDGPVDLEQSVAMARSAVDSGVATIASTPHLRPDFPGVHVDELADRCASLREALDREGLPLTVVSGAEVSLIWASGATDEELRLASYGQAGTDLLVETPTANVPGIEGPLRELVAGGYRVTLAHPERSIDLKRDEALLRSLADQGVLLQVNADSLCGVAARGVKRLARELVMSGRACVIASDAHRGTRWRPVTRLPEAVRAARDLVGVDRAEWMAERVPGAILDGRELPAAPPLMAAPRKGWRMFGVARG
jgi:protein-tyrosine phosphatase